jgi:hypothetical protein
MKSLTVPQTDLYESSDAIFAEWHGDELYRAVFHVDGDYAIFSTVEVVRNEAHDVEDADLDTVPGGVVHLVASLGYEIKVYVDDGDDDDDHRDPRRGVA